MSSKKGADKNGKGRENWIDIFLCLLLEFHWMVEFIMIWYFRFPNVSGLRGNMEGGSVVSPREAVSKRFLTVSRDEFLTAKSLHMWEKKTYVSFLPHEVAGSSLSSSMRVRWALKHHPSGCRNDAVMRAPASHQCGPGSIPRSGVICGLSLLVIYSAQRGFLRVLRFPLTPKTKIWIWLDCVNC